MSPGFFLVLEGPEGAGKSTLADALVARMRRAGLDPVAVREPGGTPAAELARRALLEPDHRLAPETELLFVAAARADLVRTVIRPALDAGRVVLADRYDLSTAAYQGAGRGLDPATVAAVNAVATGGLRPDLTLVLDVPAAVGRARQAAAGKAGDRMEREDGPFHERVAAHYLAAGGDGVRHLDGTLPPEPLAARAWEALVAARPETFGPAGGSV